jgi:hypothetical protein
MKTHLDLVEIKTFGTDARGHHDILFPGFERLDGVVSLLLG